MSDTSENQNPKPEITNDQRVQISMEAAAEIFREVVLKAHNVPNLRPIDLPNVFVSCIIYTLKYFESDLKMEHDKASKLGQLSVQGLAMTLAANGYDLGDVLVKKMPISETGIHQFGNGPVSRA